MSAPITRAQAIAAAEATASQQSMAHTASAAAPVTAEQLRRTRVQFIDSYDSRWQRDPGRANGPYS